MTLSKTFRIRKQAWYGQKDGSFKHGVDHFLAFLSL